MTRHEYRAIACPEKPSDQRDLLKGADPFCATFTAAINDLAGEGWDYLRAETIEVRTRRFFRSRSETRTFLVFRREARPLVEPRPIVDLGRSMEKIRGRRVRSEGAVEFVRSGGRRITPAAANSDTPARSAGLPVTAAE